MGAFMTRSNQEKSLDQTIAAIQALDLAPIKFKATRAEDGYGWSSEYADAMESEYKRYLILHAKAPDLALAPERDVDRFWHMHILDTRKYAADCKAVFGRFLHHFPYLGLRGKDDERALQEAFAKMQSLYAQTFGEPMPSLRIDRAGCSAQTPRTSAAWCSVESEPMNAAWCSVESQPMKASWCSVESQESHSPSAAWCSVESAAEMGGV
jgi:hypothetical protein